ncbi:GNAT family N-acetyltransferase [Helicobacter sp. 23-1045]
MEFVISKPTLRDIPAMRNLILPEVQRGVILDRSEDEMASAIRSYSVVRVNFGNPNNIVNLSEAKNLKNRDSSPTAQNDNVEADSAIHAKNAEFSADSAPTPSLRGDSTESPKQSTNFCDSKNDKNQLCEATESRPLRGAKNREQGCSSATADFLLEADKRGSPPKSEKAAAFWRVGGAGRGVQPFLRKEISESNLKNGENIAESQNLNRDSSLVSLAQNDKKNAESHIKMHEAGEIKGADAQFLDCHEVAQSATSRNDENIADSAIHAKNAESNAISQNLIAESTHPLTPSAREGGQVDSTSAREGGQKATNAPIIAFAALQILSPTLAEIRSLIVGESYRRMGLATHLINHILDEARALNIKEVLALTYQKEVFAKIGFVEIAKDSLPNQKIWADCIKCKKFPICDEIALLKTL